MFSSRQSTSDCGGTAALPISMPVSSRTSRAQVWRSVSVSLSSEPVTLCQKPGLSARSISSTSSAAVWITTSTERGIL